MTKKIIKISLLGLFLSIVSLCFPGTIPTAHGEEALHTGQYILGPGDILKITLYLNALDREQVTNLEAIPVTAEGSITIPLAGDIKASGLTSELLAVKITDKLKSSYKNPFTVVVIKEHNSNTVTVLGDYFNGKFPIMQDERLLEFVSRSANARNIPISYFRAKIIKKDGVTHSINIRDVYGDSDIKFNPVLENGDQVVITKNTIKVTILGDVKRPGFFEMQAPSFLLDAIANAGGMNYSAKTKEIRIRKPGDDRFSSINLDGYYKNKNVLNNPMLGDGDIIYVPSRAVYRWNEIRDLFFILSTILSMVLVVTRL